MIVFLRSAAAGPQRFIHLNLSRYRNGIHIIFQNSLEWGTHQRKSQKIATQNTFILDLVIVFIDEHLFRMFTRALEYQLLKWREFPL